jgi:hypothetical protein
MRIRIAHNIKDLSDLEKIAKFQTVLTKLANNAEVPIDPAMLGAAQALNEAAREAVNLVSVKKKELSAAVMDKEAKVNQAMEAFATLASLVESKLTDPAQAAATGLELVSARTPSQPMPRVENNVLTSGDNAGTADGAWNSTAGAKAYKVQISDDPTQSQLWKPYDTVSVSHIQIVEQPSGKRLWTRVCAVNSLGSGPWSDPATAMVP